MIKRIQSNNYPNFFFLTYDKNRLLVNKLLIIPKHFFTQHVIAKRKALYSKAKRAGWVGCNIDLTSDYGCKLSHASKDSWTCKRLSVLGELTMGIIFLALILLSGCSETKVDSCLDHGGSFDYEKCECDFKVNHEYKESHICK